MTQESIEHEPDDIYVRIFPFEPRRELARKFVEEVSKLDCVKKVFAMQVGRDDQEHFNRVFVITNSSEYGIPIVEDMDAIIKVWSKVCTDSSARENLGHVPILTEELFDEDRQELLSIRYKETTDLWERTSQETLSEDNLPGKLNPNLN